MRRMLTHESFDTTGVARRVGTYLGLVALLASVFGMHLFVLYPGGHVAVLYALPVLLAAWLFRPSAALTFAALALAMHSLDSIMDGTDVLTWTAEAAAIALVSWLGIWATEQARAYAQLARENARLAEERQREADRMRDLSEELSEAKETKERFMAMVTHEIAGVITVLSGHAQLLARREEARAGAPDRSVHPIVSQTQRLNRLVGDLRDLSRIERGSFDIYPTPCDLVALTRKLVKDHQAVVKDHRITLESGLDSVPGTWDSERLALVLRNLVANAVKYSPGCDEVKVEVHIEGGHVRLSVSDKGIGIAPSDLRNLFKPYSRTRQATEVKGTGLGLYISKAIVEAHGGTIEVQSEPGRGSTFTVRLPLGQQT